MIYSNPLSVQLLDGIACSHVFIHNHYMHIFPFAIDVRYLFECCIIVQDL